MRDPDAKKGPDIPEAADMVKETAPQYAPVDLRLTYEDYCRISSGERYELLEGDLRRMTPAPSVFHQEVSGRIEKALRQWIEDHDLGKVYYSPIDVVLSEHNVVQPDILYISRERLGIIKEAYIRGAPDLVVEILSPSTAELDQVTKRRIYGRYGVREFWIVDPDGRSIEVAAHNGRELATVQVYPVGTTLVSPLLGGFELEIDGVFRI
ncbi:MAG TPA: Uma2 family endonuclease [Firmicutes bacterium]|nr:Uma2 family endonuclease [Bacillota bacterium]